MAAFATLDRVSADTPDGVRLLDNLSLAFGAERAGTVGVLEQRYEPGAGETVAATLGVGLAMAIVDRVLSGQASGDDLAEADWTLSERIEVALEQVGLAGLTLDRLSEGLSGGERTRLRLAGLLIAGPDLLLLDEPTNHLDAQARRIVTDVLGRWKGGAVVVSHDTAFLDAIRIEENLALVSAA